MAKRKLVSRDDSDGKGSGGAKIKVDDFKTLLKRVYLQGAIADCVLETYKGGRVGVKAIDMTNSIFAHCYLDGVLKGFKGKENFGIGNIQLLSKYFSAIDEDTIAFDVDSGGNRVIFRRDKKRSHFDFLLKDADLISTKFESEEGDYLKTVLDTTKYSVTLSEERRDSFIDLCNTLSMAETKQVRLIADDDVRLVGGLETGHMFEVGIGKSKPIVKKGSINLIFNAEHLYRVLSVLDFDEGTRVKLHFGDDAPLVVLVDEDNFWVLSEAGE